MTEGSTGVSVGIRRKSFIDLLFEKHLVFVNPARERLATSISEITEGFVGSDLESICREAGMLALREDAAIVTRHHFEEAQKKVHPMMNERLREYYRNIQQHFKGGLPKQVQPRNTSNSSFYPLTSINPPIRINTTANSICKVWPEHA